MGTSFAKIFCAALLLGPVAATTATGQELSINAERLKSQESISLKINSMEVYMPGAEQSEHKHGQITGVALTSSVKDLQGKNHVLIWGGKTCDPLPEWMVRELIDAKKTERRIQVRYSAVLGQKTKCIVGMGWY